MDKREKLLDELILWAKRTIKENGRYSVDKNGKRTIGMAKIKCEGMIANILRELGELPDYDPFGPTKKRSHLEKFAEEVRLIAQWDAENR